MTLEQQVVSFPLARKLKEVGVKQESYFWWNFNDHAPEQGWFLDDENLAYSKEHTVSAFTSGELGEMLPGMIASYGFTTRKYADGMFKCSYGQNIRRVADTEANARASLLIHLIEQGIYKV